MSTFAVSFWIFHFVAGYVFIHNIQPNAGDITRSDYACVYQSLEGELILMTTPPDAGYCPEGDESNTYINKLIYDCSPNGCIQMNDISKVSR